MFKKNILFFFSIISTLFFSQGIHFQESSFSDVLAKAKKENKLVFLDAYASWCGPCKMLERNVFSQKEVGDYYNLHFVNSHFDMEKGEGVALAKKYRVTSYPTLLFLDGDGVVVNKSLGYLNPAQFLDLGKMVMDPEQKIENKINKFNQGETQPEFLMDLIKNTYNNDYNFAKKVSERYFANKKPTELTKDDVGLLFYFSKFPEDANFIYLMTNKSDVLKWVPENTLNDFEKQIKLSAVLKKAIDEEHRKIDEDLLNKEFVDILGEEEGKLLSSKIRTEFYFSNKNYNAYQIAAIEYYQNTELFDASALHDSAWNFYLYVEDHQALLHAADWCLASIKKQEDTFNTDTLARIYYKIGDYKKAKFWAEKSISIAKAKKAEYTSTEELLKKLK